MFLEIKFQGGLGNQMFQYATGRALCIKNNISYLLLNIESYKHNSLGRNFSLANCNIEGSIISNNRIKQIFREKTKLNRIFSAFSLHQHVKESNFLLHELDDRTGILTSLNGYWQSEYYFSDIRTTLLNELLPRVHPVLPFWVKVNREIVAVHVRRTDYLFEDRYGFLGLDYYLNAFEYMRNEVSDPFFVVFSDDLAWCRKHFNQQDFMFVDDLGWTTDYLQLYLMSKCNHQIIANSSFSWWGAWLNTNSSKIVVRPQTPFKDKSLLYQSHYPDTWVIIEN
jgi:hypothetical protein